MKKTSRKAIAVIISAAMVFTSFATNVFAADEATASYNSTTGEITYQLAGSYSPGEKIAPADFTGGELPYYFKAKVGIFKTESGVDVLVKEVGEVDVTNAAVQDFHPDDPTSDIVVWYNTPTDGFTKTFIPTELDDGTYTIATYAEDSNIKSGEMIILTESKSNEFEYTAPVVEYDVTVDAAIDDTQGAVTVSVGEEAAAATAKAKAGDTVTITVAPVEGFEVDTVTYTPEGAEEAVTVEAVEGAYTFEMPDKNVEVSATFKEAVVEYDVTVDAAIDDTQGAVTVSVGEEAAAATAKAKEGDTVTITVAPVEGFEVDTVTYTPEGAEEAVTVEAVEGAYTFEMPDKNVEVSATFKAVPTQIVVAPNEPVTEDNTQLEFDVTHADGRNIAISINNEALTGDYANTNETSFAIPASSIPGNLLEDGVYTIKAAYVEEGYEELEGEATITIDNAAPKVTITTDPVTDTTTEIAFSIEDFSDIDPVTVTIDGVALDASKVTFDKETKTGTATIGAQPVGTVIKITATDALDHVSTTEEEFATVTIPANENISDIVVTPETQYVKKDEARSFKYNVKIADPDYSRALTATLTGTGIESESGVALPAPTASAEGYDNELALSEYLPATADSGEYTITVKYADPAYEKYAATVIIVDGTAPVPVVKEGSVTTTTDKITVSVTDDNALDTTENKVTATWASGNATGTITLTDETDPKAGTVEITTGLLPAGTEVTITVYDAAGNEGTVTVKVAKTPLELPGITSVDGEPVDTETDEVCVAAPDPGAELEIIFNDDNNLPEDETTPAPTLPDKYYKVGDAEDATPVKVEGNKGKLVNSDFPAGASEIKISVWYEGYEEEVYEVTVKVLTDVTITADNEGAVAYNAGKVTGKVKPNSADVKISLYEDATCETPVKDAEGKAIEVNATAAAEGEEATWGATVDLTAYINKSIYAKAVCAKIESKEPAEFKVAEPKAPAFVKVTYFDAENNEVEATKEEQEDGSVIFYAGSSKKYNVYVNEGENATPVPADKVLTANSETIEFKTEANVAEITSWTPAAGANTNELTLKYKGGSDNAVATAQIIVDVEAPVVASANGMIGETAEAADTITNEATAIVGVITDDNKVEGAEVAITITPVDAEEGATIEPIKVKADADGKFTTTVSGLNAGDVVSIVATDLKGNVSKAKEITVTAAPRDSIVLANEYGQEGEIYVSSDNTKIDMTVKAHDGKDVIINVYDKEDKLVAIDTDCIVKGAGETAVEVTYDPTNDFADGTLDPDAIYTVKASYVDPGYEEDVEGKVYNPSFQIKFTTTSVDHPVIDKTTVTDRSKEIVITTTPVGGAKEVNVKIGTLDPIAAVKAEAAEGAEVDTWKVDITKITDTSVLNEAGCLKQGTEVKATAVSQNGRTCDEGDDVEPCKAVKVVYYEETSIVYVDPAITKINFTAAKAATEEAAAEDAKAFTQLNTEIDVAFTAGAQRKAELEATIQGGSFTTATPLEITEITPGNYTATYTGATTLNDGEYTVTVKYIDAVVTDTESIAAEDAEISIDAVNEIYTIDTTGPEVTITGSIVDGEASKEVTNRSTAVTGTSNPAETEGGKVSLYVVDKDADVAAAIAAIKDGTYGDPVATTDTINEDGTWQIDLTNQLEEGQKVVVVAEDPAGNLSDPAQTEVVAAAAQKYDLNIDGTAGALAAPYVNLLPVDGQGKTLIIEGTGKAGEQLDVTVSGVSEHGTEINDVISATVGTDGTWSVELTNANAHLESRADGSDIKVSVAYTSGVEATEGSKTVAYLRVDDTAPTTGTIDQDTITNRTTEFSGTCEPAEDKFEEPTDEPLANEIGVDAMTVILYVADDAEGTNAEVLGTVTIPAAEEPAEGGSEGTTPVEPAEGGSEGTTPVEPAEGGSEGTTPVEPAEGGSNNTWSITLTNPVTEAGKFVYITVTDSAGNVSNILDPTKVVIDDTSKEDAVSDPIEFVSALENGAGDPIAEFPEDSTTIYVNNTNVSTVQVNGTAEPKEKIQFILTMDGDEAGTNIPVTPVAGKGEISSDGVMQVVDTGEWAVSITINSLDATKTYTLKVAYVEDTDGDGTLDGIRGQVSANLVIDNAAPELTVDPVYDRDDKITGKVNPAPEGEDAITVTVNVGEKTYTAEVKPDGTWEVELEDTVPGDENPANEQFTPAGTEVTVTATDRAGNETTATTEVETATMDSIPAKELTIDSPKDGTKVPKGTKEITVSGTGKPGEELTVGLEGGSYYIDDVVVDDEGNWSVTISDDNTEFTEGKHTIVATYNNIEDGEETPNSVTSTFTVASESKPSGGGGGGGSSAVNKPIVIENVSNEDQPTVSGKGEPNKEIEVFMINTKDPNNTNKTGDSIGKTKTDKNGNWSIEYPADLTPIEPGEYKVTAQYTLGENSYTGRTSAKFTVDPSNTAINNENDLLVVQIDNPKYYLNGKPAVMDSAPFIDENDRTMLPVRVVANALGISDADITWDDETKTATFTRADGVVVSCTVGSNVIKVGDQDMVIDTVPVIRNDRIYLPMRALFNAFNVSDAHIIWDGENRTVTVTKEALDDIAAVTAEAPEGE